MKNYVPFNFIRFYPPLSVAQNDSGLWSLVFTDLEMTMQKKHPESGKPWKITLAALVGLFLVAMAATMFIAVRKVSRVVDPDYYSHGLHYGETHKGGN